MKTMRNRTDYGKVAVLMGGVSSERAISLMSGQGTLAALQSRGIDAYGFDPAEKPLLLLKEEAFDRVFVILHGGNGENGTIQGALEVIGLPYTGCGVLPCALSMDKLKTRLLWQALKLPTPDFVVLDEKTDWDSVVQQLGLPLFVKPVHGGSSLGVSKVKKKEDFEAAYQEARKYDDSVLAEQFIDGGEYTVLLLDGYELPPIKIEPATEFYNYEAKYFRDDTQYHCPSGLAPEAEITMKEYAKKAFRAIGGKGWGRVDLLMNSAGEPYLLEVNTVPGMTKRSLAPISAKQIGLSYEDLTLCILETSFV